MQCNRSSLYTYPMLYALGTVEWGKQTCVVAATEDHGPIVLSAPPFTKAEILVPGPGGCMSLVSHPSLPGELFAIMGCFVGYKFRDAGIYRIRESGHECTKLFSLPFAHRMQIMDYQGQLSLFVANLAADKTDPSDWSQPGALYRVALNSPQDQTWPLQTVLEGLHKNHGIFYGSFEGRQHLWVSGQEGLFCMDPLADAGTQGASFMQVLPYEVSEMALFDLDGDGHEELVTIEPFHGSRLSIYKQKEGAWLRVWEAALEYGHCVLAGKYQGRPSILVSNRAGSKDLVLFRFESGLKPKKFIVDTGIGAANMLIHSHEGKDLIFATAQDSGELLVYEPAGG